MYVPINRPALGRFLARTAAHSWTEHLNLEQACPEAIPHPSPPDPSTPRLPAIVWPAKQTHLGRGEKPELDLLLRWGERSAEELGAW